MRKSFRLLLTLPVIAALAVCFAGAAARADATPEVRDQAHLFSAPALEQVDAIVREIRQKLGKDLTIVTFASIPPSMHDRFLAESKEVFYENWLRDEARRAGTNGVFILIVKDPGRLQIGVGIKTRTKAFTESDRDQLRELMIASMRKGQFDTAIIEGSKWVLTRMGRNLGVEVTAPAVATHPTSAPTAHPASAPATRPPPASAPSPAQTLPASAPARRDEGAAPPGKNAPSTQPARPTGVESNNQ